MTAATGATDGRRPIKRALVSVYDKSGLDELARGARRRRCRHRLDRLDGEDHRRRGRARDPGRGADRLPRVPRRPGQDAAPEGARRHPRRHPQPRPRAAARRPRRRGLRPRRRQPLPVPRDRRVGRERGRVRRADRHRRPVDGARLGQEPRERRHRDEPGGIRPRRRGASAAGGFTLARAPAARGRGVRAHGELRQRRRELDGHRRRRHDATAPASRPGPARPSTARRCCATARTRTSRPRSTATGVRAWPAPSSCTARRCPTTTTSTPTPRCAPPTTTATSRPSRSSSTPTRAASPSARTIEEAYERAHATDPVSAYGGIIAANRTVTAAMAAAAKPVFTEVIIAPDYEPEALEILTAKKNLRILRLPAGMAETADRDRDARRSAAACSCRPSTRSTPSCAARTAT